MSCEPSIRNGRAARRPTRTRLACNSLNQPSTSRRGYHEEAWTIAMNDDKDHLRDHCGVMGVQHHPEAARLTYLGLYALQHRGQESAGIVSSDGQKLIRHVAMGLVADIFDKTALE